MAQRYGVGYVASGRWPNRDWLGGRLVVPSTDPDGRVMNLYGRAIPLDGDAPKGLRHDHLPGRKGWFNAVVMRRGDGPLFVCEGVFDALSLIAAGYPRSLAIIGLDGWRWEWLREIAALVLALDADEAGQDGWRRIARAARLRGKTVNFLPPAAYGGYDDPSAAWMAGALDLESYIGRADRDEPKSTRITAIRPQDVPSILERLAGGPVRLVRQTVVGGVRRFEYARWFRIDARRQ